MHCSKDPSKSSDKENVFIGHGLQSSPSKTSPVLHLSTQPLTHNSFPSGQVKPDKLSFGKLDSTAPWKFF